MDQNLNLDEVEVLAFTSLRTAGASEMAAHSMAKSIRAAERDGIRSHGLMYLPIYIEHLQCGNLFKALNLGETYELFSPGSGENLKASIARAVAQKEPIVGYYWGPSDVIGKYKMVRLGMPESDPTKFTCLTQTDCADPQVTGWAKGEIAVAVTTDIKDSAPDVAEFLSKMQVPNDLISEVLAWGDDNKATPEEVALYFLKTHEAVWSAWVPADVADKIRASL